MSDPTFTAEQLRTRAVWFGQLSTQDMSEVTQSEIAAMLEFAARLVGELAKEILARQEAEQREVAQRQEPNEIVDRLMEALQIDLRLGLEHRDLPSLKARVRQVLRRELQLNGKSHELKAELARLTEENARLRQAMSDCLENLIEREAYSYAKPETLAVWTALGWKPAKT